jgi:hypothetical protein
MHCRFTILANYIVCLQLLRYQCEWLQGKRVIIDKQQRELFLLTPFFACIEANNTIIARQ